MEHLPFFAIKGLLFKAPSIDNNNMQIASELNKSCPIMVDSETRLDNTLALPGKVFAYNYTLINIVKDSIDPDQLEHAIKPTMLEAIRSHPDMEYQRNSKITLSYNYKDKNGKHILQFKIKPEEYE